MGALGVFRDDQLAGRPSDRRLARAAGVAPTTVGDWLRGRRTPQTVEKLLVVIRLIREEAINRGIPLTEPVAWEELDWRTVFRAEAERRADGARAGGDRARALNALGMPVGRPIEEVTDPFELEVHRPILVPGHDLSTLPTYIGRDFDRLLNQRIEESASGASTMAVLVGGSSTGKTRACWEAVQKLRRQSDPWHLWHPHETAQAVAVLEHGGIRPYTVIWLNELYVFLRDGDLGDVLASRLRSLLADPGYAPVLILGSLWQEHWEAITTRPAKGVQDRYAHARLLLEGRLIPVPAAFDMAGMEELNRMAANDVRLSHAMDTPETVESYNIWRGFRR
jgi:hypothetical protein